MRCTDYFFLPSFYSFCFKVDIEMDGKMLNSHGVDFLDGPLGLDIDEKDLDEEETRRDMAKILKELKQKHPDKEVCNKIRNICCYCCSSCTKPKVICNI